MSFAGVYIHIPFCRSRCSYCDFATDIYSGALAETYVDAVCREIESSKLKLQIANLKVDTIYFGGGTPSLLSAQQTEKILRRVFDCFDVAPNSEITMEMNPGTVTPENARDFRGLGINRASYGAQTFDDRELKRLGRKHTALDVRKTIEILRAADFANVSFDLIAGLPNQSLRDWQQNLEQAIKLAPEHLSLYLLEIHEATPLAKHIREGKQPLPDEDLSAEMYELMLDAAARANYEQYEISNFCRRGFESIHNSKYWTLDAVYGFGCSAHSFDGSNLRSANERDTRRFVEFIEKRAGDAVVEKNEIDRRAEFAFLGLRLTRGIDLNRYEQEFGVDLQREYAADLPRLFDAGLLEIAEDHLRLTKKGALFSNEVFRIFI